MYCEQCIDEMLAFKGFADISKKSIYLIDTPLVETKEFITKNIKDGFLGQALKNYAVFNSGAHTVRDYISSFLK